MSEMPMLEENIQKIQSTIETMDPEQLQSNLYQCIGNFCSVVSLYKNAKGAKGWASRLREGGREIFSAQEQKGIEEAFEEGGDVFLDAPAPPAAPKQRGGGGGKPTLTAGSSLVPKSSAIQLSGDDVSLDAAFYSLMEKLDGVDAFWSDLTRGTDESPGIYKLLSSQDVILPPTPLPTPPIPVPVTLIHTFLIGLLEFLRASVAISPIEPPLVRVFSSFLLVLSDAISGNWRQMILSSLGLFSKSGVALGVAGRVVLSAWLFVNPMIRTSLTRDIYQATKSLVVGFLLWAFQTLAPGSMKTVVDAGLARLRAAAEGIEGTIAQAQAAANPVLQPLGYQLRIKLDTETLKKINIEDLQNIQSLSRWGNFICAAEMQELLAPLLRDPIFRIVVELLGIPTVERDVVEICGASYKKPLQEVMKDNMEVVPMRGGSRSGAGAGSGKTRRSKFRELWERRLTRRRRLHTNTRKTV